MGMILLTVRVGGWLGSAIVNVKQRRLATGSLAAVILAGGATVAANVTEVAAASREIAAPSSVDEPSPASRGASRTPKIVASGRCGASFYDEPQMTANGERFNPDALTAASKTLAFDTRVRVTSVDTGKSVVVRINDRGPYVGGRCLDLSRAAFDVIDSLNKGIVTVNYEILK